MADSLDRLAPSLHLELSGDHLLGGPLPCRHQRKRQGGGLRVPSLVVSGLGEALQVGAQVRSLQ